MENVPPQGRVVNPAPEHYLAHTYTMPGYWGKGETVKEAVASLRGQSPSFVREHGYVVFRVHPETSVNHVGQLVWPLPHKPVLVENKLKHEADLSEFD